MSDRYPSSHSIWYGDGMQFWIKLKETTRPTIEMLWSYDDVLALRAGLIAKGKEPALTFKITAMVPAHRTIGPEATMDELPSV
jgi:hypothetical protein